MEVLCWLRWQHDLLVLVLVDIVDDDLTVIAWHVRHYEVLLESGRKDRVATIVDMLPDDVHSSRGSAVEGRSDTIEISEASEKVLVTRLVLLCDRVIDVLVNASQLLNDGDHWGGSA